MDNDLLLQIVKTRDFPSRVLNSASCHFERSEKSYSLVSSRFLLACPFALLKARLVEMT